MDNALLLQMPLDILINIFLRLKPIDLINLARTCKYLKNLILHNNTIWRLIHRDKFILHNSIGNANTIKLSWFNKCRIAHNWTYGIYKSKVIIRHNANYMPWLKYYDCESLVTSQGSQLFCYSIEKKGLPNCKQPLWKIDVPKVKRNDKRTNDISRFVFKQDLLACGNRDGCVAVYKTNDIKKEPRFVCCINDCHNEGKAEVTAVEILNKNGNVCVATASEQSPNIVFWQRKMEKCKNDEESSKGTYRNYKNTVHYFDNIKEVVTEGYKGIRCLAINEDNDKLAFGVSGNSVPLLLDVNKHEHIMKSEATRWETRLVRDIQWHDVNTIAYVTHFGKLELIDIRSENVTFSAKDPFGTTLYCVRTDGNHGVVTGSAEYSRVSLFDLRYGCLQIYFTQKRSSPVYSVDFDSTKLIAAADRGLAALNFNVFAGTSVQRDYSKLI